LAALAVIGLNARTTIRRGGDLVVRNRCPPRAGDVEKGRGERILGARRAVRTWGRMVKVSTASSPVRVGAVPAARCNISWRQAWIVVVAAARNAAMGFNRQPTTRSTP
jgi:hypothetical protein